MASITRTAIATLAVLASANVSAAQDPGGYVGGSAMLSTQDAHRPGESPSLPRSGVSGTSLGATAEIGWVFASNAGVSVEASLPARFDSVQETDYFSTFRTDNLYRDLIISVLARAQTPRVGGVRFGVSGGPSLVQESSVQRRADGIGPRGNFTTEFTPFGPASEITRWAIGATLGADIDIAVTRHVSIVPQMRVHWVRRSNDTFDRTWFLGLGPWLLRPAVGVRTTF